MSPGLVFAGFVERFTHIRSQVIGETELTYLDSLTPDSRREAVERFLSFDIPVVFVTKGLDPPAGMVDRADERGIPIVSTRLKTASSTRDQVLPEAQSRRRPSFTARWPTSTASACCSWGAADRQVRCVLDLVERGLPIWLAEIRSRHASLGRDS